MDGREEKGRVKTKTITYEVLCLVFFFFFSFFFLFFKYRKNILWFESQRSREWDGCGPGRELFRERDFHLQWSYASSCMVSRILDYPNSQSVCNHQRRLPLLPCVWS